VTGDSAEAIWRWCCYRSLARKPHRRYCSRRRGGHLAGDRPRTDRRELRDTSGSRSVLHQVPGCRLVASYLGETDPKNPLASPLYGDLRGLPPIRVHVGDDEVLLDDSRRYVERAVAAGVDAALDVWMGMPHGFVANVDSFNAARQALSAIGAFTAERLR